MGGAGPRQGTFRADAHANVPGHRQQRSGHRAEMLVGVGSAEGRAAVDGRLLEPAADLRVAGFAVEEDGERGVSAHSCRGPALRTAAGACATNRSKLEWNKPARRFA